MTERAYTVREIDQMRDLVTHRLSPRRMVNGKRYVILGDGVDPAVVEDRLRTYMLAGVSAEELEAEMKEAGAG